MTIRNNKEVFTTSIRPDVLSDFRNSCWDNNKKINEVIEKLIIRHLSSTR